MRRRGHSRREERQFQEVSAVEWKTRQLAAADYRPERSRFLVDWHQRRRHQEWLKFLRLIKSQTPADKDVHLICDNYATHKHPKILAWAKRNPRFHFHFTPTGASWLNMVERFFRDLTDKALRRGSFYNVDDLTGVIQEYINAHNDNPKPFIWTASANDILAKVKRARRAANML